MSQLSKDEKHTGQGRSRNKSFENYSESHKCRLKRGRHFPQLLALLIQINQLFTAKVDFFHFLQSVCFSLQQWVGCVSFPTNSKQRVLTALCHRHTQYDLTDQRLLQHMWWCVPWACAAICKSLPRHYKIKQRIHKLNELWNIRPIPHAIGVQQSLEQRLHVCLEHLLKISQHDAGFVKKQLVRVKLSKETKDFWDQTFQLWWSWAQSADNAGNVANTVVWHHTLLIWLQWTIKNTIMSKRELINLLMYILLYLISNLSLK